MTREPFDPNNIRREDIFRAKEERRKELAGLPFEKKIEIVKRFQTVVTDFKRNVLRMRTNQERKTPLEFRASRSLRAGLPRSRSKR